MIANAALFGLILVLAPLMGALVEAGHVLAATVVLSPLILVVGLGLVYAIVQGQIIARYGELVEARVFRRKKKDTVE